MFGVVGVDDLVDVFLGEEFFESVEVFFGIFDGFEFKFFWDDWEGFEVLEIVFFFVDIFGYEEFDDVVDG